MAGAGEPPNVWDAETSIVLGRRARRCGAARSRLAATGLDRSAGVASAQVSVVQVFDVVGHSCGGTVKLRAGRVVVAPWLGFSIDDGGFLASGVRLDLFTVAVHEVAKCEPPAAIRQQSTRPSQFSDRSQSATAWPIASGESS